MAMVNMNNLLNGKDSRWLQLEVCREFQRNKCSRPDTECKFAHPPANVEVQNGRVTACYDSIKGRCNREKPPCKYFHPPQHLKDQLLINGRNHLALKNALMQQMGLTPGQPIVPGQVPAVVDSQYECLPLNLFPHHLSMSVDEQFALMAANPYLTGMPQVGSTYSPYFAPGPIMPTIMGPDPTGVASPLGVVPQTAVVAQQKMPRSDRLEMDMKSVGSFYYDNFAFPGMMPYKRPAADKSGVPVYQPNATTYQQLMQLQQPFVPVSCEYTVSPTPTPATSSASPPASSESQALVVVSQQQQQQLQQQQQPNNTQPAKESEAQVVLPSVSATHTVPATATVPSLTANLADPAAIAKEVAQQNYAKAVKLAAVGQSIAAANNNLNPLNPLNYTGVALNKQAMSIPPPNVARYPLQFSTSTLGLGIPNPYAAAMTQANLMNLARPPPTLLHHPYTYMRQAAYPAVTAANQFITPSLLTAQYPVSVAPSTMTNAAAAAASNSIAAAAAQNNNNNVVMPPYKKLKTS